MFLLLYGQLALPLEQRDVFQCIYPMTDPLFVDMLQQTEPGSLLMHAKSGRGVTIAFINPNNNHWRLVVLDGVQRLVVLFDPLGARLPASVTTAVTAFVWPSSASSTWATPSNRELELWGVGSVCGISVHHAAASHWTDRLERTMPLARTFPCWCSLRVVTTM